ncbi:hypothetical protein QBC47DRAFT_393582 [Echria macrotheca]|uniref:SMP-30/Gluconolactonase/LRE-like region domain-containing protein n=1 Tax=Echria macrotheca TaxID=438768 RepID=A0AAJ0F6U4_9PEZI|nr:hypothetical protein QBC47DRAFT_393582 [Echria macrotheca]
MTRRLLSLLALGYSLSLASPTQAVRAPKVTELLKFPNATRIENFNVLPNGHLLVTTLSSSDVFTVDPDAPSPQPEKVVTLEGSKLLFGVTPLANGLYAISGGAASAIPNRYEDSKIHIISLASKSAIDSISVPDVEFLNGLVTLPKRPHVILGADSFGGRIVRIDTHTRETTIAWAHESLGWGTNSTGFQLGVNGIRIRDGYLYFSNARLGTFSRIRIDDDGKIIGKPKVIAYLPGLEDGAHLFDDFDFDREGNAYVTAHPSSLVKITPGGKLTTVVGGDGTTTLSAPTSAGFAKDGRTLYVTSMTAQVVKVVFPW